MLYLAGLALLAGLSYALLQWVESSLQQPDPPQSQAPILIIEQFRAVRLNEAGLKAYVIEAPRLEHFPHQAGTKIKQPVMDWYQPNGQIREWQLQSEQGWIAADRKTVKLNGAVTLRRPAASSKIPIVITTRNLQIKPEIHYAETAAPTQAITPNGVLNSIGVRAWLDQERLELLSKVRGTYEPPPP